MAVLNAGTIARTFGIKDPKNVKYTRTHVEDQLIVSDVTDDYTELTTEKITPSGDPLFITLSPYLLSLGAVHTSVVEQADQILVYVQVSEEDLDLSRCKVRGYIK